MPSNIKAKATFGTVKVDHVAPQFGSEAPVAYNIHLSFEEALKLHLALGQVLAKLNGYNRATRAGRRSAANLCLFTTKGRITVNEGQIRERPSDDDAAPEAESGSES